MWGSKTANVLGILKGILGASRIGYKQNRTVSDKLSESISVADFGAVGDGVTDDGAAIMSAVSFANGLKYINFEDGKTYATSIEISLLTGNRGAKINGNNAVIKSIAAMTNVVSLSGATKLNTVIRDLNIDGNGLAQVGFFGSYIVEMNSLVQNLLVKNAVTDGMIFDACQVANFKGLVSHSNGGNGLIAESCNGALFEGVRCVYNSGDGIVIRRGATNYSGGCSFHKIDVEVNGGHGIRVVDTTSPVIISGWSEANEKDGVNIGALSAMVHVHDINVIGSEGTGAFRAVRIENGAKGCLIENCLFNRTDGSDVYSSVQDNNTDLVTVNIKRNNSFGSAVKHSLTQGAAYFNDEIVRQQSTVNIKGFGGYLSGGEDINIVAASSLTLRWKPTGVFNIAGGADRGAYLIKVKIIGYFTGYDQTIYKEFDVYAATGGGVDHDQSSNLVADYGDGRKSQLTMGVPIVADVNGFEVVLSNLEANAFTGVITWTHVMTTKGTLVMTMV